MQNEKKPVQAIQKHCSAFMYNGDEFNLIHIYLQFYETIQATC